MGGWNTQEPPSHPKVTCFSALFSSMGYCILFVHGMSKLCTWLHRCGAATLSVSTVLLLLLFSWKTMKQNEIWLSRESLFRYDWRDESESLPINFFADVFVSKQTRRHGSGNIY